MSDVSVLDFTKVYAVVNTNTNIVTQSTTVHEPITTGAQGPQGIPGISASTTISQLLDVSITGLVDGALLEYNSAQGVWIPTTTLSKQAIECGQY